MSGILKGMKERTVDGRVTELPVTLIDPNPSQPRRYFDGEALMTLADSIRRYGILQPLSVTKSGERYTLVAGERRLRAAKFIGLEKVPVALLDADAQTGEEMAVVENIQREDLNIFEEARAIASLVTKYSLTQETVAKRLSVSQSYVANKLRLLKLSPEEEAAILEAGLTERHARSLLRIRDEAQRSAALRHVVRRHLNVAATEEYVDNLLLREKTEKPPREEQNVKMGMRDVRLFCNSIDKAVESVKRAGVPVTTRRTDCAEKTEILIEIARV